MEEKTGITIALLVLLFCGLLLISKNVITGMVIGEQGVCTSQTDCTSSQVCCKFYSEERGVCNDAIMCPRISEVTREGQENYAEFQQTVTAKNPITLYVNGITDEDVEEYTHIETVIGLAIILLAFVALYFLLKSEHDVQPHKH